MNDCERKNKTLAAAKSVRMRIIEMAHKTGRTGAHLGGSLSLVEIMACLYCGAMDFDASDTCAETRARLILSKGHGVPAQYAALREVGVLTQEDILTFKCDGSAVGAHPSMNPKFGIEFSSGSLGQGLSLGVGVALALKRRGNSTSRVFVILGDGECNEGQVWEAAMAASHFKLDNLVAVVDRNVLQYDGNTEMIMPLEPFADKWTAFGFDAESVDGHSVEALLAAFSKKSAKPRAIIARTVKGKGVSFAENVAEWHNGVLTDELYKQAVAEQGGAND